MRKKGYSYSPSKVLPQGRHTAGTSFHMDKEELGANLGLVAGVDRELEKISPIESSNNGLLTSDSGLYPDIITFLYYVRQVDYTLFSGPNRLYVEDSLGRHKKIVVFKKNHGPEDKAQVTTLYYQVAAFPTKISGIQTYYDDISNYLDAGNNPFYDYNSPAQQNIYPNP